MNFAVLAALVAVVAAEPTCDTSHISTVYYTDGNCGEVDKDTTDAWGTISDDYKVWFNGECNWDEEGKTAFLVNCDDDGVYWGQYSTADCSGDELEGSGLYEWDVCYENSEGGSYEMKHV